MARTPKFAYRSTSQGWLVNVPASLTASGKRERCYFPTRDKAKEYSAALREKFLEHGASTQAIPPSLADDATKAAALLEKHRVALTQSARFYVQHHDKRAKSPTLAAAWTAGLAHRKNHRKRTLADFRAWEKALPAWFMAMNCYDIGAKDIRKALNEVTDGPTRWKNGLRNISAMLGDVVKSELIPTNPAAAVHVARAAESEDDDVTIYTPDELKSLFAACIDYPLGKGGDRLCARCAAPFAVMAFAGIRPIEIVKLKWEHISLELENIRVGEGVAKKKSRRNVRIQPTLAAWLETVPAEQRTGKLVPGRWFQKTARVRKAAGIDGNEKQDALRHSFGTYLLATEGDLDKLKADMGHAHIATYLNHYHKAVTKAEALPYWQVLPVGVEIPNIKIA
jgi:integrase